MILNELWGEHIRAGNFLFKYAWNTKYCSVYGCGTSYPKNYYLWDYLMNPPNLHEVEPDYDLIVRPTKWEYDEEEQKYLDGFKEDFIHRNTAIALNYFFQSYKAFEGHEQQVYNALRFKEDYVESVKNKYAYFFDKECVLVSIRLGDFVSHDNYYQIPIKWYLEAIEQFSDMNVVITSDHIEHAKELFKGHNFMYAEPNNTHTHAENFKHYHSPKAIEHLVLGTLFKNFIISQSTFSWWQAWLGSFNGGKVIHCGKVFSETGPMKNCNTDNYYLPNWTKH